MNLTVTSMKMWVTLHFSVLICQKKKKERDLEPCVFIYFTFICFNCSQEPEPEEEAENNEVDERLSFETSTLFEILSS